ncbi:ArsR/SmtB family transcription factor [Defluviitalea phaphyphila]|uniref:ArsR/SmtB family transcription factor n=1 Tax=Defluviitalea phaphyphila TaxID=1473580 RepID=UPI000730FA93|nr:metalloregulator ArsR/SmtB family transcription factor [Defluviitalea phaphyphila]
MNNLTDFFKIMSDETRLRIVILLAQEELCVCEICGILELSQPKVSKHLAKLRDKGFVKDKRKEQYIFYSLEIKNKIFKNLIKDIIDNIQEYPQLKLDSDRLVDKEKYINLCNINDIKN